MLCQSAQCSAWTGTAVETSHSEFNPLSSTCAALISCQCEDWGLSHYYVFISNYTQQRLVELGSVTTGEWYPQVVSSQCTDILLLADCSSCHLTTVRLRWVGGKSILTNTHTFKSPSLYCLNPSSQGTGRSFCSPVPPHTQNTSYIFIHIPNRQETDFFYRDVRLLCHYFDNETNSLTFLYVEIKKTLIMVSFYK